MEQAPAEYGSLANLLPPSWKTQVTAWLAEDTPTFDYGGFVVGEGLRTATLFGKSAGVVAGRPFFDEVFHQCGCSVEWHVDEGSEIKADSDGKAKVRAATVTGPTRGILLGERVALNTFARCSGIASKTRSMVSSMREAGYKGIVAGTRKTTPGFRLVEKYAMMVGGADSHRMDLSSMIMLKDNHVWSRGSITDAVKAAKSVGGFALKVEVEVQTEAEADEAIEAGADVVMLDNFTGDGVKVAARSLKERWQGKRHFLLEVSGGLTPDNVATYVCNGRRLLRALLPKCRSADDDSQTWTSSRLARYIKAYLTLIFHSRSNINSTRTSSINIQCHLFGPFPLSHLSRSLTLRLSCLSHSGCPRAHLGHLSSSSP